MSQANAIRALVCWCFCFYPFSIFLGTLLMRSFAVNLATQSMFVVAKEYVSATSAPSQLSTFQLMKFFPETRTDTHTNVHKLVCVWMCVCVWVCVWVCEGVASVDITSYLLQVSFRYWQITWQCHRIRSASWTRSTERVDGWQIVTVKVNTVTLKVQAAKSQEVRGKPFIATQHVKLAVIKECMSGVCTINAGSQCVTVSYNCICLYVWLYVCVRATLCVIQVSVEITSSKHACTHTHTHSFDILRA